MEKQMALFGYDVLPTYAELTETKASAVSAYCDAMKYGALAAAKAETYEVLCAQLCGYADGVAAHLDLSAHERELVRNHAFSAADPIMMAKQH